MGEVSEMFDVKPSLLRYWVAQFDVLQPKRNKKGNRMFTVQDVEHLKVIYHLVKERGMTLDGAKRAMKRRRKGDGDAVRRDAELMTRLRHIRALLVEVREDLKAGDEGIVTDDESTAEPAAAPAPRRRTKAVVKFGPQISEEPNAAASEAGASRSTRPGSPNRRGRRKSEESENKELFAFYEQSLF